MQKIGSFYGSDHFWAQTSPYAMTTPCCSPQALWNNLLDKPEEFVDMQNSNASFAVRFSWECQCGTWGTARTETQAKQAIAAHKEQPKEGCGECKLTRVGSADRS